MKTRKQRGNKAPRATSIALLSVNSIWCPVQSGTAELSGRAVDLRSGRRSRSRSSTSRSRSSAARALQTSRRLSVGPVSICARLPPVLRCAGGPTLWPLPRLRLSMLASTGLCWPQLASAGHHNAGSFFKQSRFGAQRAPRTDSPQTV